MSVQDELLRLDRKLWSGAASDYRSVLDDDCLVAFSTMAGVSSREEIAGTVGDSQRWKDVELSPRGIVMPMDDVAILTYRASATRGSGPYRALVSSGYVKRDGQWKLMFHQQTPIENST